MKRAIFTIGANVAVLALFFFAGMKWEQSRLSDRSRGFRKGDSLMVNDPHGGVELYRVNRVGDDGEVLSMSVRGIVFEGTKDGHTWVTILAGPVGMEYHDLDGFGLRTRWADEEP